MARIPAHSRAWRREKERERENLQDDLAWINLRTHTSNPIDKSRKSHCSFTVPLCHQPYHRVTLAYHRVISGCSDPETRHYPLHPIGCIRCDVKEMERRGKKGDRGREKRMRRKYEQIDERGTMRETERDGKKERARLFADAADSTTGGGGLTAPLHIHPRYIDLSPSSGHVAAPHLTAPHVW